VLGVFGFQSLSSWVQFTAQRAVGDEFADHRGELIKTSQEAQTNTLTMISDKAKDARDDVEMKRREIEGKIKEARLELEQALAKGRDEIGELTNRGTNTLKDALVSALKDINEAKVKAIASNIAPQKVPDTPTKTGTDDATAGTHELQTIAYVAAREFHAPGAMAQRMIRAQRSDLADHILSIVLQNPGHFPKDELDDAVATFAHLELEPFDEYGTAVELVLSGTLNGNEDLYQAGKKILAGNGLNVVQPSELVELATAIHDKRPPDEIALLYQPIELSELTPVGVNNALGLLKVAKLTAFVADAERELLERLPTSGVIDRTTDYAFAYKVAKILTTGPVSDRTRVKQALETIRPIVLKPGAPDPFGLGKLIDAFSAPQA
jgi:hypothetical protein